jgi:hypothetical protein
MIHVLKPCHNKTLSIRVHSPNLKEHIPKHKVVHAFSMPLNLATDNRQASSLLGRVSLLQCVQHELCS